MLLMNIVLDVLETHDCKMSALKKNTGFKSVGKCTERCYRQNLE